MPKSKRSGTVKLDDLMFALEYVSAGEAFGSEAYVCTETGEIYYHTDEFAADEEPLPEDIADAEKYAAVPSKKELDLAQPLIFGFVDKFLPDASDEVRKTFRKPGAYSRHKEFLAERGMLDKWYEFEDASQKEALRDWCDDVGVRCEE